MNEENKNPQPEKAPLDETRKNALLRYIGIMFVVAFVFVLISMFSELRSSEAAISELNASSTSALQKAEQLQDTNRQLETDNAYLSGRIEELEKQLADLEDLQSRLETAEEAQKDLQASQQELEEKLETAEEARENTQKAYDLLLELQTAVSVGSEDVSQLVSELEKLKDYLGETALKTYENLTKEGD